MPPVIPRRTRATQGSLVALRAVRVRDLALRDFLVGHRQIVLRPRLDERRREIVERPLAELMVIVVDLPGALGRHDHERVAGVDLLEQIVDLRIAHVPRSVPTTSWSTISARSATARSS